MQPRNQLLARLPKAEWKRLHPRLEHVKLTFKETLHEQGKPIDYLYFPDVGVISVVTELREGGSIETGTIGREGIAGVSVFLGHDRALGRAFIQVPGQAWRLSRKELAAHLKSPGDLTHLALRSVNVQMATVAQTAACNRAHSLEERLARWLLMTRDRVDDDSFPLTQDFLAQMLGVRRPTVSLAGATLQKAGLITYSRGRIAILDREALEGVACECYAVIKTRYEDRL